MNFEHTEQKNCLLLLGNFKNKHENDFFYNRNNSYINVLVDINKKLCEPNNCDIFILTDFCAPYEKFKNDDITLNEENYKKVENNIKKIFKEKLKIFEILSLNKDYINELNKIKIKMNKEYNYPMLDKDLGFFFKFYKLLDLIENYQKKKSIKYDNFILTKPDVIFNQPISLKNIKLETNTIYCWYFMLTICSNKTMKLLYNNMFDSEKQDGEKEGEAGETRLHRFFSKCGLKINQTFNGINIPLSCTYHRQRYMSYGTVHFDKLMSYYSKEDQTFFLKNINL